MIHQKQLIKVKLNCYFLVSGPPLILENSNNQNNGINFIPTRKSPPIQDNPVSKASMNSNNPFLDLQDLNFDDDINKVESNLGGHKSPDSLI